MVRAVAFIGVIAVTILGVSAVYFDGATLMFVAVAMVLVTFFSGAAVALGVYTRRRAEGQRVAGDDAEVIAEPSRQTGGTNVAPHSGQAPGPSPRSE